MPDLTAGSVSEVFADIADDIRSKKRDYQSVVSVSWGSKIPTQVEYYHYYGDIQENIVEIASLLHVPMIFAAGNEAKEVGQAYGPRRLATDTFPAELVDFSRIFPSNAGLLSAANCDLHAQRYATSQRTEDRNIFAPGVNIKCASHLSNRGVQQDTGTSFCEFRGQPRVAVSIRAKTNIQQLPWLRVSSQT